MHPLIQEQLATIDRKIADIHAAIEAKNERGRAEAAHRESMLQEHWREKKRAATLEHMADDLESVNAEIDVYEAERSKTAESLQKVLGRLKGLRGYLAD